MMTDDITKVLDENGAETEKTASQNLGKFNTAEELLSAYNALESEFTKRCQLIKQLQTELSLLRTQADDGIKEVAHADRTSETCEDGTTDARYEKPITEGEPYVVTNAPCVDGDRLSNKVLDEIMLCAAEYADVLSSIPEIMTACITRYKQKLIEARGSGSPAGMAVIVPAKRPVTLAEAKKLADEMLAL